MVHPVVDSMLVCGGIVQIIKLEFRSVRRSNGEAECSAHEDIDEKLILGGWCCHLS